MIYTGSEVAKKILDNWAEYLPRFVKVMPVEYRRALKETQALKTSDSAVREIA
jgi:glutamate synthase (NADPH/NADH) large chain